MIALPLLSRLNVREKDLPAIDPRHRPAFRTNLEMIVELWWANPWLGLLRRPIWALADRTYGKRRLLTHAKALGVTVDSRLHMDATLRTILVPRSVPMQSGARMYGEQAIDLAKRPGQNPGWSRGCFVLCDSAEVKLFRTILAPGQRRDPRRARRRSARRARLLLHLHEGYGRRRPGDDRRWIQSGERRTTRHLKAKEEGSPGFRLPSMSRRCLKFPRGVVSA